VAIVTGLTVAAATIPKAATTATAIKRSFEFIGLMRYKILHIRLSKSNRGINGGKALNPPGML
jgi:hypothetical protein